MALLSTKTAQSDVNGDILSIPTTADAEAHTVVVNPDVGTTGTVGVHIKCVGGSFEPLMQGTTPVVIDLEAPISVVFMACISEIKLVGNTVSGDYSATLNSQGTAKSTD